MRLLLTAPLVLLGLLSCAIQSIEARAEAQLQTRQVGNTTLASPIVAEASQSWEGADGIWSTFIIRVGTPSSVFRILPATSWQETWVVYGSASDVCDATVGVEADCQEDRGGAYDMNKSSTWKAEGQLQLGLNEDLGMKGVGQYGAFGSAMYTGSGQKSLTDVGFDIVGLGYSNASGVTLQNQIVSAIVSNDYWLGSLGLGFQPTNFSGYDDPQPSFAETLFVQSRIASRSWSYTAGAYYRLKSVFGSLIFGGYDASRLTGNNVTFTMAGDNLRDLIVAVHSITSGEVTLMNSPEFAFIDSSVAELWLPVSVCESFERNFGIQLDQASGYYLLNSSTHSSLVQRNPEITFTLGNQKESPGNETVDIVLPYAAFDFNISAPLLPNRTERYFPLRRAVEGRYILGRTFLQEAYVTAHFGNRTFNVSQCVFEDGTRSHIVALPERLPSSPSSLAGSGSSDGQGTARRKLSKGAAAGIVVGALTAALFFALGVYFILKRRRRDRSSVPKGIVEIDSGRRTEKPIRGKWVSEHGEQTSAFTNEIDGKETQKRAELDGNSVPAPVELAGDIPVAVGKGLGLSPRVSPSSPTRKDFEDCGENRVVSRATEVSRGNEQKEPARPSITIRTPTGRESGWVPTSPVSWSGTAGSKFREDV